MMAPRLRSVRSRAIQLVHAVYVERSVAARIEHLYYMYYYHKVRNEYPRSEVRYICSSTRTDLLSLVLCVCVCAVHAKAFFQIDRTRSAR